MLSIEKNKIEDLFEISKGITVATARTNVGSYDFDFRSYR
jgi:hypothetical protein